MPIITIQLPETTIQKLEVYSDVWNHSLPEVIEMALQHATVKQFPIAWLEDMNPELYEQQLAMEDHQRIEQILDL